MRFKLRGTVYEYATVPKVPIKAALRLELETARLGRKVTLKDFEAIIDELQPLSPAERDKHPDIMWALAVQVWAAFAVKAHETGEPLAPFEDIIDFALDDLEFIPDIEPAPVVAANPTRPRRASGAAVKRPAAKAQRTKT